METGAGGGGGGELGAPPGAGASAEEMSSTAGGESSAVSGEGTVGEGSVSGESTVSDEGTVSGESTVSDEGIVSDEVTAPGEGPRSGFNIEMITSLEEPGGEDKAVSVSGEFAGTATNGGDVNVSKGIGGPAVIAEDGAVTWKPLEVEELVASTIDAAFIISALVLSNWLNAPAQSTSLTIQTAFFPPLLFSWSSFRALAVVAVARLVPAVNTSTISRLCAEAVVEIVAEYGTRNIRSRG